ncbi:gap-Pol polyprotein, partial [Clonorchis sinensis]
EVPMIMIEAHSLVVELNPGRLVRLQRQDPVLRKVAAALLDGRSMENGEGDKELETFQSHFDRLSLNEAGIISWNATDSDVVLPVIPRVLRRKLIKGTIIPHMREGQVEGRSESWKEWIGVAEAGQPMARSICRYRPPGNVYTIQDGRGSKRVNGTQLRKWHDKPEERPSRTVAQADLTEWACSLLQFVAAKWATRMHIVQCVGKGDLLLFSSSKFLLTISKIALDEWLSRVALECTAGRVTENRLLLKRSSFLFYIHSCYRSTVGISKGPFLRNDTFTRRPLPLAALSMGNSAVAITDNSKSFFKIGVSVCLANLDAHTLKQARQQTALAFTLDSFSLDVYRLYETSIKVELAYPSASARFQVRTSGGPEAAATGSAGVSIVLNQGDTA